MNSTHEKNIKNNQGLAALITVVVIGASVLLMAKGAAYLSMGELEMRNASAKADEALYLAEACLDEALLRLKFNNDFLSSKYSINFLNGSCNYSVSEIGGIKTVYTEGLSGKYYKKIKVEISAVNGKIILDSWRVILE